MIPRLSAVTLTIVTGIGTLDPSRDIIALFDTAKPSIVIPLESGGSRPKIPSKMTLESFICGRVLNRLNQLSNFGPAKDMGACA